MFLTKQIRDSIWKKQYNVFIFSCKEFEKQTLGIESVIDDEPGKNEGRHLTWVDGPFVDVCCTVAVAPPLGNRVRYMVRLCNNVSQLKSALILRSVNYGNFDRHKINGT